MAEIAAIRILSADSATTLAPDSLGAVLVSGSHGGRYPGSLVARAGCRAAIFNDAGIGRDEAGIGALRLLDEIGIPAAVVDHRSARIGDARDMLARGTISRINRCAKALGCRSGQTTATCAECMTAAPTSGSTPPEIAERRQLVAVRNGRSIWALDSASQVDARDVDTIVLTGSHGGLLGGRPETALKAQALLAVFNDAGVGMDRAGIGRLQALDARGIAAATVSAASARIGDGLSTYRDGVVSHVNDVAATMGTAEGASVRRLVDIVIARSSEGS